MVVIISSCLLVLRGGKKRGGGAGKMGKKSARETKAEEEREVNVNVWAVTVRYLRVPQRRAQSALVQVLLVFTVMLWLSVCLSVCLTVSLSRSLLDE